MHWPALVGVPALADVQCAFAYPTMLDCRSSMRHTCSAETLYYLVPECPADCPYIVEDPFVPCAASCVARSECALGDPTRTFDDPATKLCIAGHIQGCLRYAEPDLARLGDDRICEVCARFYKLEDAGRRCDFTMDKFQNFGVGFWALFYFLLCIMIPVAVCRFWIHFCCKLEYALRFQISRYQHTQMRFSIKFNCQNIGCSGA